MSICASCKKLKDGAGAWSWLGPASLDEPNIWFSHGLCPDCFDQQCSDMLRTPVRSELKLYAQLQGQGFPGSYARVTEFIRAWRLEQGAVSARTAYVPLSFAWGEAFQFDWSEEGLVIGGVWRKVQLAHMKLCASLAFWLVG